MTIQVTRDAICLADDQSEPWELTREFAGCEAGFPSLFQAASTGTIRLHGHST